MPSVRERAECIAAGFFLRADFTGCERGMETADAEDDPDGSVTRGGHQAPEAGKAGGLHEEGTPVAFEVAAGPAGEDGWVVQASERGGFGGGAPNTVARECAAGDRSGVTGRQVVE